MARAQLCQCPDQALGAAVLSEPLAVCRDQWAASPQVWPADGCQGSWLPPAQTPSKPGPGDPSTRPGPGAVPVHTEPLPTGGRGLIGTLLSLALPAEPRASYAGCHLALLLLVQGQEERAQPTEAARAGTQRGRLGRTFPKCPLFLTTLRLAPSASWGGDRPWRTRLQRACGEELEPQGRICSELGSEQACGSWSLWGLRSCTSQTWKWPP